MSKRPKLLIVSKDQFGYHTDIVKWCEYLKDDYAITVLTFDDGKEKIEMQGVRNIYVPDAHNRLMRGILFMLYSAFVTMLFPGIIFVCYFRESIIFKKLFPWKRMILDIRTLDVSVSEDTRRNNDRHLKKCVDSYDFITCISEGVRQKLNVPAEKSAILPLGADVITFKDKDFDGLKLLYVGTLFNRNIEKTLLGLSMALKELGNCDIEYDIVGNGPGNEEEELRQLSNELGLDSIVHIHGYVRHDRLASFFEKSNIGISFVPMTDYYEYQPPTKTFEYALSGMFVIATRTFANREVINSTNGQLINDTADDFADALVSFCNNDLRPDSKAIRESMKEYEWKKIVDGRLKAILEDFA